MEPKEKAINLFEENLRVFFNAELSQEKNRLTAKANTMFWVKKIIGSFPCKANYLGVGQSEWVSNIEEWKEVLREVKKISI